jgi:ABC-2 type transport system permease protein
MTSAMTRNQVVSFHCVGGDLPLPGAVRFPPVTNLLTRMDKPWLVDMVAAFSVITHFEWFTKGVLDSRDVIFFLSVIGFSLFTTGVIIRSHRAG